MIGWDTFSAVAPVLGPKQKLAMSPSSTVHGGQHDTKYVTFELLLRAAFLADIFWGDKLEPARTTTAAVPVLIGKSPTRNFQCISGKTRNLGAAILNLVWRTPSLKS